MKWKGVAPQLKEEQEGRKEGGMEREREGETEREREKAKRLVHFIP